MQKCYSLITLSWNKPVLVKSNILFASLFCGCCSHIPAVVILISYIIFVLLQRLQMQISPQRVSTVHHKEIHTNERQCRLTACLACVGHSNCGTEDVIFYRIAWRISCQAVRNGFSSCPRLLVLAFSVF